MATSAADGSFTSSARRGTTASYRRRPATSRRDPCNRARPIIRLTPARRERRGSRHRWAPAPRHRVPADERAPRGPRLTDANGNFTTHVAPGKYEVSSARASYRLRNTEWGVQRSLVKNIVAERAPILAGIVRRNDGSPVAGAQVIVGRGEPRRHRRRRQRLRPAGRRFRIGAPLLGLLLRVVATNAVSRRRKAAKSIHVRLRATSPSSSAKERSRGMVRDPAGHPLAGVAVTMLRIGRQLLTAVADRH